MASYVSILASLIFVATRQSSIFNLQFSIFNFILTLLSLLQKFNFHSSIFYILAFCFSPAPEPRYLLLASLNFHVRSSEKVLRVGLRTVISRMP